MRMTCREVATGSGALIDGDGPLGTRLKARAHLLVCRNCRRFLGQMRQTARLAAATAPVRVETEEQVVSLLLQARRGEQR